MEHIIIYGNGNCKIYNLHILVYLSIYILLGHKEIEQSILRKRMMVKNKKKI